MRSGDAGQPVARGARTLLLLATITALGPLVTDLYLPLMPEMTRDLGATQAAGQATISTVLLGFAVGQLVIGPLSDAVGRRPPVLVGAAGYVVLSLACAVAPSVISLVALRFVAGLATAACMVVPRAVVTDIYPAASAARAYASLAVVITAVPAFAPVIGGALSSVMGWRAMFVVLAGCGLVVAALAWTRLPETLPPARRRPAHLGHAVADLGSLLRHRRFLGYLAAAGGAGGILFGWIAASSFVLQDHFGLTPTTFSLVFALNASALFLVATVNRGLVARQGPQRLLSIGQGLGVLGALVACVGVGRGSLLVFEAGMLVAVGSIGLVMGNALAMGMRQEPDKAGSASGLIGITQFTVGGLAAVLAGVGGSPWSVVLVALGAAALGLAGRTALTR